MSSSDSATGVGGFLAMSRMSEGIGLPILAVLVIVGLYLAELKDEFERSILVESSLWGTGTALALATFWGFLENYGTVSTIPMFYVFLVWWMSFSLAQVLVRRRYK